MSNFPVKGILWFLMALVLGSCTVVSKNRIPTSEKKKWTMPLKMTEGLDACFILYDLNSKKVEKVIGDARCRERTAPCSTFKIPLALMGFESGALKDENTLLKWDGGERGIASWNRDHTASSWMRDSVVWYSQMLTPRIGEKKMSFYLKKFQYGNQDLSGGIQEAWLTPAPFMKAPVKNSLKISAYEQLEFMKKLWSEGLPVQQRSIDLTKKLTYLETSPSGAILNGKTGSGFVNGSQQRIGWFVAHLQKENSRYISIMTFTDKEGLHKDLFAGQQAKEITKTFFADNDLW